jgi:hypothetical protein
VLIILVATHNQSLLMILEATYNHPSVLIILLQRIISPADDS